MNRGIASDAREPRFAQPDEAEPLVQPTRPSNPPLLAARSAEFTFDTPSTLPVSRANFIPAAPFCKTIKELRAEVIALCVQISQHLNSLPEGFKVDLELRWAPAHLLNSGMKLHTQAAYLASNARNTRQHFHKVGRSHMPFVPSVIHLIKDFPMVAESGRDCPSEEFFVVRKGADVAARRAAEISDELHQATLRKVEDVLALVEEEKAMQEKVKAREEEAKALVEKAKALVEKAKAREDKARDKEEKLEIALKQAEADSAKLMAAKKEQEEMKKVFETALEGVRDTAKAERDAAVEMKDGHRASLQLVREQHEVALGRRGMEKIR